MITVKTSRGRGHSDIGVCLHMREQKNKQTNKQKQKQTQQNQKNKTKQKTIQNVKGVFFFSTTRKTRSVFRDLKMLFFKKKKEKEVYC